jgi:hypothetical protein
MQTREASAQATTDHYRRKMAPAQIEQLQNQYVHKRILENNDLAHLSMSYM